MTRKVLVFPAVRRGHRRRVKRKQRVSKISKQTQVFIKRYMTKGTGHLLKMGGLWSPRRRTVVAPSLEETGSKCRG